MNAEKTDQRTQPIRDHLYASVSQHLNVTYVLLSPTFGMHQYTADYANRFTAGATLITTTTYPATPYLDHVKVHTPIATHNTGFRPNAIGPFLRLFVRDRVENLNVSMF
ncbi:MAG: hypothetical protein JW892_04820, partial [Anaerolineae bacterium]|nr:hypothetical protein [Anaerolineae bacterium]